MVTTLGTAGNQPAETISVPKVRGIFTVLSLLGLLAGCASMNPNVAGNPLSHTSIQNAVPQADHIVLAKHFEDTAREMQAKADEQKRLLEQYEKEHVYGWQSHNARANTLALIRKYEQAARSNLKKAVSHRQMARKPEQNYAVQGTLQRNSIFGEASRAENN
jgi:hypothetical protein